MARKRPAPVEESAKNQSKQPREDLIGSIITKIRACAPKKGDAGFVYVSRMSEGDRIFSSVREVIKTGFDPFDAIIGPIPKGRVIELFGPEASGKTDFIKKVVKAAYQKELYLYELDGSLTKIEDDTEVVVLYIDNEHALQSEMGDKVMIDGITIDGVLLECDVIEDMWKNIDIVLDAVKAKKYAEDEKVKKAAKEGKTYKPKKFLTIIAVDTIASMTSIEEFQAEWGEQDYPRMPKKLKEGFRRMIRRIGNENVIAIFSNQANDKFQKTRGHQTMDQKYNTPGGKALKFFSSTRVVFEQQPIKFVLDEDYRFQQGYVIAFMATKNRIKKPLREGRLVLLFDSAPNIYGETSASGINNEYSILETLLYLKFAEFGADKWITFKFHELGIPLTTFQDLKPDEDPSIPSRADWVAFFAAHKADIDALWSMAVDYIHKDRGHTNIKCVEHKEDTITGEEEILADAPIVDEPPAPPILRPGKPPKVTSKGVLTVPE